MKSNQTGTRREESVVLEILVFVAFSSAIFPDRDLDTLSCETLAQRCALHDTREAFRGEDLESF